MKRASGDALTVAEWRALTGAQGAKGDATAQVRGVNAAHLGKLAEGDFEAACAFLALTRRVWWFRLPDPLKPTGEVTDAGALVCVPTVRDRATDYMGADLERGCAIWGVEVKATTADRWNCATLRPAQVRALDELAQLGALAGVYVVRAEGSRVVSRWWVPWSATGCAVAVLRFDAPDVQHLRLGASETWLDVAHRLKKEHNTR